MCGEKHERQDKQTCIGHTSEQLPCKNWPINGGTVCYQRHGGKAGQVQDAARRRLETARAERAVATYGLPREVDPFVALGEEIARTAGHVEWIAQIIAEMEPIDLVWGETLEEHKSTTGEGMGAKEGDTAETETKTVAGAGLTTWLALYKQERAHLVHVCATAIKCGLKQREVEILESQGRILIGVFRAVFEDPDAQLDDAARARMRSIASKHLRLVRGIASPETDVA